MHRWRQAALGLLVALATYAFLELLALGTFFAIEKRALSLSEIAERRSGVLRTDTLGGSENTAAGAMQRYVPHPHLGYVVNPALTDQPLWWIEAKSDPFTDDPEIVRVFISGGSVAYNLRLSWPNLREQLATIPRYAGRRIKRYNIAGLGHKQPQQLMAVAYYLALGGRIDLLINLDGFNEVGSSTLDNLDAGVQPLYPVFWSTVTRDMTSPADLEILAEIAAVRKRRRSVAEVFESFRYSATAGLFWHLIDRASEGSLRQLNEAIRESGELPEYSRGPRFEGTRDEALERAIEVWAESSVLLQQLATTSGFEYFHFLQPNQYVPESKRHLTQIEREKLMTQKRYLEHIPRWYPQLQQAGEALRSRGVDFHDLTRIFEDMEETAYIDDCCHLSRLGRHKMAAVIGDIITDRLARAQN